MARVKNKRRGIFARLCLFVILACLAFMLSGCGATKKQREIANSQLLTGIAYLGEHQDTQALRCFWEAEALDPRNERIYYFKTFIYVNRGAFADAKATLQKALQLNNSYSQAHSFLGSLYLREGEYDTALSHFHEALKNPVYDAPAVALYNIGWILFQKGEQLEALNACLRALTIDPESPLRVNILELLGKIYLQEKNYRESLAHYQEAAALAPKNMEILLGLAQARLAVGDKGQARQLLARIIATDKVGNTAIKARDILDKSK